MSLLTTKLKKPSKVIANCPACGSEELIRLSVDVLCAKCDWLSAEMHVECGGMDNLFTAYLEHFHDGLMIVANEQTAEVAIPREDETSLTAAISA